MIKKQYRLKMSNELIVLTSDKFTKIFFKTTPNYEKKYKIGEMILTVETEHMMTDFDFAVLSAIITLYEEHGMLTLFKPLNILKLITGNTKAHFTENSKKSQTISEQMIIESIHHLQQFKLTSGSNISTLINVKKNGDYLMIVERPLLISCYGGDNLLCLKKVVLDIGALQFQIKKGYIHQNRSIVSFKFWTLNQIINSKEEINLDMQYLYNKLDMQRCLDRLEQKLLFHSISFDIYRKRKRQIQSKMRKILNGYFKSLLEYKIIERYSIGKLQIHVSISNTI